MATQSGPGEELLEALSEVRHLRETIVAMRQQLEASRFDRDEAVQKAVRTANDEILALRATIAAQRQETENIVHEKKLPHPGNSGCGQQ